MPAVKKLDKENLIIAILEYFRLLGLYNEATKLLTSDLFGEAITLKLPNSGIIADNREDGYETHESHIAITGPRRFVFYNESKIEAAGESTPDEKQKIVVSSANIDNLMTNNTSFSSLGLKESFTLKKIAYRSTQHNQVQLSKIGKKNDGNSPKDGDDFLKLRRGLTVDDILVFLKYKDEDKFLVIGLPVSYYSGIYSIVGSGEYFDVLEFPNTIQSAINIVSASIDLATPINNDDLLADAIYQQLVNSINNDDNHVDDDAESYTAEDYQATGRKDIHSNRPYTDPNLGKRVARQNNYKCIFCSNDDPHNTFIKDDGTPYIEAHHIIPVANQPKFRKKLDTKANIAPVCPLCHCKLHYGNKSDVDALLTNLYEMRKDALHKSGIDVTLDQLKEFYH